MWPGLPALGAQRQAQHPGARPGKYYRIDRGARGKQAEWNQPVRWPLALLALAAGAWRRAAPSARASGHGAGTPWRPRLMTMLNYLIRRSATAC
jgi:hypothetical protein